MEINEIETLLNDALELSELHVTGADANFQVIAVGELFAGVSRVKKQQIVYGPLAEKIADGSLHALTIKAFTPEDWQRERKFLMPE